MNKVYLLLAGTHINEPYEVSRLHASLEGAMASAKELGFLVMVSVDLGFWRESADDLFDSDQEFTWCTISERTVRP